MDDDADAPEEMPAAQDPGSPAGDAAIGKHAGEVEDAAPGDGPADTVDERGDEQGGEHAAPAAAPSGAGATDAESTGHGAVDAVLASLEGLEERPVAEHVAVFESAHDSLRSALNDAGEG
jgi:hypothetical protein